MSKTKVLVVNDVTYDGIARNFGDTVHNPGYFISHPEEFKLVLFTGGADIDPVFYGHSSPYKFCFSNIERDKEEILIFDIAVKNNIPITGICRGCQLINVVNGGEMIHHVDNHEHMIHHKVITHTGEKFKVNSLHHQMCVIDPSGYVLAWAYPRMSDIYIGDEDKEFDYTGPETEALYYPKTKAFGVQYHPEMMPNKSRGYEWYVNAVFDLINESSEYFINKYCGVKHVSVGK